MINWQSEAEGIIKDVSAHIQEAAVSSKLKACAAKVYINLTTKEQKRFCIKLSAQGLQIVGHDYDHEDASLDLPIYETPYALLTDNSKMYINSFGTQLSEKLSKLESKESL